MIGIYQFKNTVNNKIYIGSSTELDKRKENHIYSLRKGTHHSVYFQRAWDKYGEESFKYEILELLDDDTTTKELLEREQFWLDKTKCYEAERGYNILKIAGSNKGFKMSAESRAKLSKSRMGIRPNEKTRLKLSISKRKENLTKETREKLTKVNQGELSPNSKLKESEVIEIKKMLADGVSRKEVAEKFNYSLKAMEKIAIGELWGWLEVDGFVVNKQEKTSLTIKDVEQIKISLMKGVSLEKLSNDYNVTKKVIQTIKRKEKWKSVFVEGFDEWSEKNTKRLMSAETELEIFEKLNKGLKQKELALEYGVSRQTISRINVKYK